VHAAKHAAAHTNNATRYTGRNAEPPP